MSGMAEHVNGRRPRHTAPHWCRVLLSVLTLVLAAVIGATSATTAQAAYTYDTAAYAYAMPAQLSLLSAVMTHAQGSPAGPGAASWVSRVSACRYVVAAESGAGVNEHSLLSRLRMESRLNPDRGSIGGSGFTGTTTGHGATRIAEAGFDDIDVAIIRAGQSYEQADGAMAFVSSAGRGNYNMIVQNTDGAIVTAHRGMTYDDLSGLAENFGWSGW